MASIAFYRKYLKHWHCFHAWPEMSNFYSAAISISPNSIHPLLVVFSYTFSTKCSAATEVRDSQWWLNNGINDEFFILLFIPMSIPDPGQVLPGSQQLGFGLFFSRHCFRITPRAAKSKNRPLWSHASSNSYDLRYIDT